MNIAYREMLRGEVRAAVARMNAAADIDHDGEKGFLREAAVRELFRPLFPTPLAVVSGIIVSAADNRQSSQQDVVICDRTILPVLSIEHHQGLVPIESALFAIEVKSQLDATKLKEAHIKADKLASQQYLAMKFTNDVPVSDHKFEKAASMLFALSSDLTGDPQNDIERYRKVHGNAQPPIRAICVVGRGAWYWYGDTWHRWAHEKEYDEVLHFIAQMLNSLKRIMLTRPDPRIGKYFTDT